MASEMCSGPVYSPDAGRCAAGGCGVCASAVPAMQAAAIATKRTNDDSHRLFPVSARVVGRVFFHFAAKLDLQEAQSQAGNRYVRAVADHAFCERQGDGSSHTARFKTYPGTRRLSRWMTGLERKNSAGRGCVDSAFEGLPGKRWIGPKSRAPSRRVAGSCCDRREAGDTVLLGVYGSDALWREVAARRVRSPFKGWQMELRTARVSERSDSAQTVEWLESANGPKGMGLWAGRQI